MISTLFDLTRELQDLNAEFKIFKCLSIELDLEKDNCLHTNLHKNFNTDKHILHLSYRNIRCNFTNTFSI